MMQIDLSIIIPTYRRPDLLREAIASCLEIGKLSFEVLVVDDCPDGSARQVVASIGDQRVHYRKRDIPTGGWPAFNRNEAAAEAGGRIFYFLDDDDRMIAAHIEAAWARLDQSDKGVVISLARPFSHNPELELHETQLFKAAGSFLSKSPFTLTVVGRLVFGSTVLVCSSCMVKREAFTACNGFDTKIELCEDLEFYFRVIRRFGYVFSPEPIVERRIGQPALMLNNAHNERVANSYRMFQSKYRVEHGHFEFLALKIWTRARALLGL